MMSNLQDNEPFDTLEKVWIEGETEARTIERCRADKNMMVLKLSGIDDRNSSEKLRNKCLFVPKEDLELDDDTYFVDDLVDMQVVDENGNPVGCIKDVLSNTNQDLYLIEKTDGTTFMLPAVKEFILCIDIQSRKMKVHLIDGIMDL